MIAVWESDEQEVIASHFHDRVRATGPLLAPTQTGTDIDTAAAPDDAWMDESPAAEAAAEAEAEQDAAEGRKKSKKKKKSKKDKKLEPGHVDVESTMRAEES
jgi:hypothetical protein